MGAIKEMLIETSEYMERHYPEVGLDFDGWQKLLMYGPRDVGYCLVREATEGSGSGFIDAGRCNECMLKIRTYIENLPLGLSFTHVPSIRPVEE